MNLHMKYTADNTVSSFFYYMWNVWSEEECKVVYGDMHRHFWEKWCQMTDKGVFGAAERFYAELTDHYREKLAGRAVALYDGKAKRRHPDDSEILVCGICGSTKVQIPAWVDANTKEFHRNSYDSSHDRWCDECDFTTCLCYKDDFMRKMQEWWKSNNTDDLEYITGLKASDFPSEDTRQTFAEAADEWWKTLDYEQKRNIYNVK